MKGLFFNTYAPSIWSIGFKCGLDCLIQLQMEIRQKGRNEKGTQHRNSSVPDCENLHTLEYMLPSNYVLDIKSFEQSFGSKERSPPYTI